MVYHMLRRSLGDSLFWQALRELYQASRFTLATWDDVEAAFSAVAGEDLSWFFEQWLTRPGMPAVSLKNADYLEQEGRYEVTFTLRQEDPVFRLDLPVRLETTHGAESHLVRLAAQESTYVLSARAEPTVLAIDNNLFGC